MKHAKKGRTLGRVRKAKSALMRGLVLSLIEHGKITTSEAKAKELRPYAERLITLAKRDTVAVRRAVASRLGEPDPTIVKKIFSDIAPKYRERPGGYTRITKMGTLRGRTEAVIELV